MRCAEPVQTWRSAPMLSKLWMRTSAHHRPRASTASVPAGAYQHRIADGAGDLEGLADALGDPVGRLAAAQLGEHLLAPLAAPGAGDASVRGSVGAVGGRLGELAVQDVVWPLRAHESRTHEAIVAHVCWSAGEAFMVTADNQQPCLCVWSNRCSHKYTPAAPVRGDDIQIHQVLN